MRGRGRRTTPRSTTSATTRKQTTLYRQVQQHAATLFEQPQAEAGADLAQFVKVEPGHKQSGLTPPRAGTPVGAGLPSSAADPAALGQLAAQPKLVTPALQVVQVVHRVVTRHLLGLGLTA